MFIQYTFPLRFNAQLNTRAYFYIFLPVQYSKRPREQSISKTNHIRLILGYWLCKIKFSRLMDFIYYYPKCFIHTFLSISKLCSPIFFLLLLFVASWNRDTSGFKIILIIWLQNKTPPFEIFHTARSSVRSQKQHRNIFL